MKKARVKVLKGDKQQIEEDLVLKKEKVYMLKDEDLRVEIIQLYYNVPVVEYRKRWKIIKLVMRNYQQPRATKDIGKYMNECNICQKMKN